MNGNKLRKLISVLLAIFWLGMSAGASFHFHPDGAVHHDCPECNFQKNLCSADLQQPGLISVHYVGIAHITESDRLIPPFFNKISFFIRPPPIFRS